MRHQTINGIEVEVGSGNVYADLEFSDAEEMLAKSRLVAEIGKIIKSRKLTQVQAARLMGINQPKVSALLKGDFEGYSQERLINFLKRLGRDIEVVIKPAKKSRQMGRLSVVFA